MELEKPDSNLEMMKTQLFKSLGDVSRISISSLNVTQKIHSEFPWVMNTYTERSWEIHQKLYCKIQLGDHVDEIKVSS